MLRTFWRTKWLNKELTENSFCVQSKGVICPIIWMANLITTAERVVAFITHQCYCWGFCRLRSHFLPLVSFWRGINKWKVIFTPSLFHSLRNWKLLLNFCPLLFFVAVRLLTTSGMQSSQKAKYAAICHVFTVFTSDKDTHNLKTFCVHIMRLRESHSQQWHNGTEC